MILAPNQFCHLCAANGLGFALQIVLLPFATEFEFKLTAVPAAA
jgi:hypothetical protein